jgi:hypothetical protein
VAQGGNLLVTHKTGLPSVEKKLLDVYREEAAYLLRLAYFELFEGAGLNHNRGLVWTPPDAASSQKDLDQIVSELSCKHRGLDMDKSDAEPLREGLALLADREPSFVPLVQCSLRLAPSHSGLSYIGRELMIAGDLEDAECAFRSLLRSPLRARHRSSHLSVLSTIQLLLSNLNDGLQGYEKAAMLSSDNSTAAFSWLWAALSVGSIEVTSRAITHVDSLWPEPSLDLSSWLLGMREQRRRNVPFIGRPGKQLVLRIQDRLGYSSAAVLDEVLM